MPRRKKQEKSLLPEETPPILEEQTLIPDDFINLNRVRFTYKGGKTQVTLLKTFRTEHLQYLKRIPRLDSIAFEHGGIVNAAVLTDLAPLNLRYLKIGGDNQCADTDLAALENWKELEILNLHCSPKITDVGLEHLRKLERLKFLYIYCNYRITDGGLIPLTFLPQLERLYILSTQISSNYCISGEGWHRACPSAMLRELTVDGHWTDEGIAKFCQWLARLPQLENLSLRHCESPRYEYSEFSRLSYNCLIHLEKLFGEPSTINSWRVEWESIRSRKRIVEFMELVKTPVLWSDLEKMLKLDGYKRDRYIWSAQRTLTEQGVLEKVESENGEPMYRLVDDSVGFPWESVEAVGTPQEF